MGNGISISYLCQEFFIIPRACPLFWIQVHRTIDLDSLLVLYFHYYYFTDPLFVRNPVLFQSWLICTIKDKNSIRLFSIVLIIKKYRRIIIRFYWNSIILFMEPNWYQYHIHNIIIIIVLNTNTKSERISSNEMILLW